MTANDKVLVPREPTAKPDKWVAVKPEDAPYYGIHTTDGRTIAGTASGLSERDALQICALHNNELSEADDLIRSLGYDPDRFRTDSGWINHYKLAAAIRFPEDYSGLTHSAAAPQPAEDGLPELPFSPYLVSEWSGPEMVDRTTWTAYTADQMLAFRAEGIAYAQQQNCRSCYPDGVYATDGSGPYDCYACGRKAATESQQRSAGVVVDEAFDAWLARDYPLYDKNNIVVHRMRDAWNAALTAALNREEG